MRIRTVLSIFLCFIIVLTAPIYGQAQTQLSIAAAGDLHKVLEDIKTSFEAQYPDIKLKCSLGASGHLTQQIQQGAPYDIFLSADEAFPDRLQKAGLADSSGPFLYAIGRLIMWVRKDLNLDPNHDGLKVLLNPKVLTISIANPKLAPYGRAAEATLYQNGLYDLLKSKLIFADNVMQAAQFLYAGAADAGIVSYSYANNPMLLRNGIIWKIPTNAHPPIKQAGIIINYSKYKNQAHIFRSFLLSSKGQAIFAAYGFGKI